MWRDPEWPSRRGPYSPPSYRKPLGERLVHLSVLVAACAVALAGWWAASWILAAAYHSLV